jgi:hypothetical protein
MTWLEYWAWCRQSLGMSEREYRRFAPRQVLALAAARCKLVERADFRIAALGAGILNSFRSEKTLPIQPAQFFPWLTKP